MPQATFSELCAFDGFLCMDSITIDFQLPASWLELSDKKLRYVFELLAADVSADELKMLCLLRWGGTRVIGRQQSGRYLLKQGKRLFEVSHVALAEILSALDWLCTMPAAPVRLSRLRNRRGITADFSQVPFETYIVVDNFYQGYLSTQNDELLDEVAGVLYPGVKAPLTAWERIAVFYWIAALKEFFAHRYPDFLQPVNSSDNNLLGQSRPGVEEAMNAQIRALTKGDVTKEQEILQLDTWRALTELNAQAKEYKQLNNQLQKK